MVVVGLCSEVQTRLGASEAHGIGLVRDVSEDIRPSLLSQRSDITAFRIDFLGADGRLVLSRSPLLDGTERLSPIVDLRTLVGSPVRHYAARIRRLVVNGAEVEAVNEKPSYGVIDTGTSGVLVSRGLYEQTNFDLLSIRVELEGNMVLSANRSTCRGDCVLLALPVDIPWPGVDPGQGVDMGRTSDSASFAGNHAHVLFLGLALLPERNGSFVVDIDQNRMAIIETPS